GGGPGDEVAPALNPAGPAGANQPGGRPLPRHVADDEPEATVGEIDIVEEVAADGAAGDGRGRRREKRPLAVPRREQRLLNRGSDFQFLLELCLVERLAIEPRILDRQRRLGRQRLERRLRRGRAQRAALAAVEVE